MNMQKDDIHNKQEAGPLTAVLTGAILGAGVVAAGVVLKDKKNRDNIKEVLSSGKDKAMEHFQDAKQQVQDVKHKVQDKQEEIKEKIDK